MIFKLFRRYVPPDRRLRGIPRLRAVLFPLQTHVQRSWSFDIDEIGGLDRVLCTGESGLPFRPSRDRDCTFRRVHHIGRFRAERMCAKLIEQLWF